MKLLLGDLHDTVDRLAFGPGERLLAAVARKSRIDLWDATTGVQADTWSSRKRTVHDLAWLADGRVVVAVDREPIEIIDPRAGSSETIPDSSNCVRIAPIRDRAAFFAVHERQVGGTWRFVRWEPPAGETARARWDERLDGWGASVTADSDGARVAVNEFRRGASLLGRGRQLQSEIVLHDGVMGDIRRRIPVPSWSVTDVLTMFPDGRLVAAYITDRVHIWDADTGDAVGEIRPPGFSSNTTAMAAHPDGRRLLTVGQDGAARVWDAVTAAPLAEFHWGIGKLASVAVSRDGLLAAVGGEDGRVVVWDLDG